MKTVLTSRIISKQNKYCLFKPLFSSQARLRSQTNIQLHRLHSATYWMSYHTCNNAQNKKVCKQFLLKTEETLDPSSLCQDSTCMISLV